MGVSVDKLDVNQQHSIATMKVNSLLGSMSESKNSRFKGV